MHKWNPQISRLLPSCLEWIWGSFPFFSHSRLGVTDKSFMSWLRDGRDVVSHQSGTPRWSTATDCFGCQLVLYGGNPSVLCSVCVHSVFKSVLMFPSFRAAAFHFPFLLEGQIKDGQNIAQLSSGSWRWESGDHCQTVCVLDCELFFNVLSLMYVYFGGMNLASA